ncbi:hypothetical protein GIB67_005498 [Kingdonia uniflora]|uniref:Uncharacterized protein n=1 Tax=Kingdonia uniflora TaxID=39325 RepID=A0A7J7NHH3_9MAGN|nr:hypothetical protein GIB67_005498 [Kingdonia uniflora]
MCDDSGNLMAIAQQVINQKQQLEQQQQLLLEQEEKNKQHQQQQQQQQQQQRQVNITVSGTHTNSIDVNPPSEFYDPFSGLGHNDSTGFRFPDLGDAGSTEFETDEWLQSLFDTTTTTTTTTENSKLHSWHNNTEFTQFGTSESTQFDLSPSPSDLSRLLFSDCRKTAHDSPSPPPAKIARVSLPEVAKEIEIADSTHGIPVPFLGKAPSRFLMATGNRLLEFAKAFDLNIEYEPILTPIQELDHSCFKLDQGDTVVVNFVLQLYNLLDETPIAVERALRLAKALNPTIVTLAEYEVSLNNVDFLDRFKNALSYFKAVFESIDSCFARKAEERLRIEKYLFGQRIACIVGSTITERTEKKEQWKAIMENCGFQKIQISHYSVSQADHLLSNYSPKFSYVERDRAYLSITWGEVEVITVTLWH